jgi:hypothetical protein
MSDNPPNMLSANCIRTCLGLHVAAVALTGLWSYWDRTGPPPQLIGWLAFPFCLAATLALPFLPIAMGLILWESRVPAFKKLCIAAISAAATWAHIIAMVPLVQ